MVTKGSQGESKGSEDRGQAPTVGVYASQYCFILLSLSLLISSLLFLFFISFHLSSFLLFSSSFLNFCDTVYSGDCGHFLVVFHVELAEHHQEPTCIKSKGRGERERERGEGEGRGRGERERGEGGYQGRRRVSRGSSEGEGDQDTY